MAVPTIYVKLLRYAATEIPASDLSALRQMLSSRVRLMVSGSAALPSPVFDDWFQLSGRKRGKTTLELCCWMGIMLKVTPEKS